MNIDENTNFEKMYAMESQMIHIRILNVDHFIQDFMLIG